MPWGKYPEQVKPFRKWAQDQVDRGTVAGNKVTSFKRRRRRAWRRKKKKKDA